MLYPINVIIYRILFNADSSDEYKVEIKSVHMLLLIIFMPLETSWSINMSCHNMNKCITWTTLKSTKTKS